MSASDTDSRTIKGVVLRVVEEARFRNDLNAGTLAEYEDVLKKFVRFCEYGLGIRAIDEIDASVVQTFISSRRIDGREPSMSHQHNRRTACRFLFRHAVELGLSKTDAAQRVELPPRLKVDPRPLSDAEIDRCRGFAIPSTDDLIHPIAWALAEATARTYEIARVRVDDVDLASGSVHLPGSPRTISRVVRLTEWGSEQLRRRMAGRPCGSEPLVRFRSRRVPRASASMAVIETLRRADLREPTVRPVSIAAWRGAVEFRSGMSIGEVAMLLGLTSLDRTASLIRAAVPGSR
ncbi:MAG: hypothetical protein U0V56_01590 [Actinomycetota bacterium]